MNYIILTAGVMSLFVGILTLKNSNHKKDILFFSIFCFITSIWTTLNFSLLYFKNMHLLGAIYASGTFVSASLLAWTYVYVKSKGAVWKQYFIFALAGIIAILSLFTNLIIEDVYGVSATGLEMKEGALFSIFGIFLAGSVIFALVRIFSAYRKAKGDERRQKRLVLLGVGGFTGFSILVSSILPMLGIFRFTNLDSPSSLIFIILTFVAIFKYRFLNMKVIVAHFLVAVLIIFSAIEVFSLSDWTVSILLFRIIFLLIFFAIGILLVEVVASDVRRKEELEVANAKLKQLDDAKSEFISIASHQLRTPLTAIKGFTSLILGESYGKINGELAEAVEDISSSNQHLISLVDDLLNVSKIEAGKISRVFEKNDIREICQGIVDMFAFRAKEKKIKLEFKKSKTAIPMISCDKKTLTEGISNILDNALKYTNKGKVSMEISSDDDFVQIKISDTGIGIAKEHVAHLFSKFARGANATRQDISGTGLGLYVAKSMIENNGGSIHAESDGEDKGSQFIIEIPIKYKSK